MTQLEAYSVFTCARGYTEHVEWRGSYRVHSKANTTQLSNGQITEPVRLYNLDPNENLFNHVHYPHPETHMQFASVQGNAKCLETICGYSAK